MLPNLPEWKSRYACSISARVFITKGPLAYTASPMGRPAGTPDPGRADPPRRGPPVQITYALTPGAEELVSALQPLAHWSERHRAS